MNGHYDPNLHHRRSIRLKGYDYSQCGAYFATICAQNRELLFGNVVADTMRLNEIGLMVKQMWDWLPQQYPYVSIGEFVVMPNHFHGILIIIDDNGRGGSRTALTAPPYDNKGGSRTAPTEKRKSVGRLIGVFNEDKTMNENLVWYVAYGSNILRERFLVYINGGSFRGGEKKYPGCKNNTPPIKDKPFTVPYELYFGNSSRSWSGKGVAFIDPNKESVTRGRAYLITLAQFEEIHKQEGKSPNWYGRTVEMGCDENKIPYRTFTSKIRHPDNAPSDEYLAVIEEGLQELAVVHPNYREGQPND